jgi:hypothetical protein
MCHLSTDKDRYTFNDSTIITIVEHGIYPVFYSDFLLFLPVLLSPLEALLAFAQLKYPSQHLTMCALPFFFLTLIICPGTLVIYRLL